MEIRINVNLQYITIDRFTLAKSVFTLGYFTALQLNTRLGKRLQIF